VLLVVLADISFEDFLSLFQFGLVLLCFGEALQGNSDYTRDSLMVLILTCYS
jgi:hypothetical protein